MFPIGPRCGLPEARGSLPSAAARAARCALAALAIALTAGAGGQQNLGFETLDAQARPVGWSLASGGANAESDAEVAAEGGRSLKLTRAAAVGLVRVTQRVPAGVLRGPGEAAHAVRIRLTGSVRSAGPQASPVLWLRIDGPHGPLFLDTAGYGLEPAGDQDQAATVERDGADERWRRYELELPFPGDVDEIAFGVALRGEGSAWFDALELTVVGKDRPPAGPAAVRYLDAALALMREHSLNRTQVDWPAVRLEALEHARGATSAAETHLAVRFAVRELGDRHSYLQSAAVTRALATTAVANARTGSPLSAPTGRRLDGNLAYVQVPSFAGGTPIQQVEFAEELKNVIQANDSAGICGWVVDLRTNTGGNLWPMLAGIGPLLGEGELAASVYPDGRRVPVWHRDGQAGFGEFTQLRVRSPYRVAAPAPVAVLLGPGTASSAEVLAVAFKAREATRSFGAPTRGLSAGNRTFALADGASLVLTVAATSDTAGRVYEGPIVPDEIAGAEGEAGAARAPADGALEAGAAWLRAADSCR